MAKQGTHRRIGLVAAIVLMAAGCGAPSPDVDGSVEPRDASIDDASPDGGAMDGEAEALDAGAADADVVEEDAGAEDADADMVEEDAGAEDAGAEGAEDADVLDAAGEDAGVDPMDAGPMDAGLGVDDAGIDAVAPDAGTDAGATDAGPPCVVPTEYATIAAALAVASCRVISVLEGVYAERLFIARSVDIIGSGAVVIDGSASGSVIRISGGETVRVRLVALTVQNGASRTGAGIQLNRATLTLEDVLVSDNVARSTTSTQPSGGGIDNYLGTLVMRRSRVSNNTATYSGHNAFTRGAGILSSLGVVSILEGSAITDNAVVVTATSGSGQGEGAGIVAGGGDLTIEDSTVARNTVIVSGTSGALALGAGIQVLAGANVRLGAGARVEENVARATSGGVARAFGGGAFVYDIGSPSTLTTYRAHLVGNRAEASGGATLTLARGGAVAELGTTTLTFTESTIADNTAHARGTGPVRASGGGASFDPGVGMVLASFVRSTIEGNVVDSAQTAAGGALEMQASSSTAGRVELVLDQCTVSGNEAVAITGDARGGGLAVESAYPIPIQIVEASSSTITDNHALGDAGEGGGVYVSRPAGSGDTPVHLRGSLLYGNTAASGADCATADAGAIESIAYDLFGTQAGCLVTGAQTEDRVGLDPLLGPLADNGGPTETHLIGASGAAHEAGDPSGCADHEGTPYTLDQRGAPRPVGRCDIGAVERAP